MGEGHPDGAEHQDAREVLRVEHVPAAGHGERPHQQELQDSQDDHDDRERAIPAVPQPGAVGQRPGHQEQAGETEGQHVARQRQERQQ